MLSVWGRLLSFSRQVQYGSEVMVVLNKILKKKKNVNFLAPLFLISKLCNIAYILPPHASPQPVPDLNPAVTVYAELSLRKMQNKIRPPARKCGMKINGKPKTDHVSDGSGYYANSLLFKKKKNNLYANLRFLLNRDDKCSSEIKICNKSSIEACREREG